MKLATIKFGEAHRLRDNGVGDYDFECDRQARRQFVPVMLWPRFDRCPCPYCGEVLIAPANASAFTMGA